MKDKGETLLLVATVWLQKILTAAADVLWLAALAGLCNCLAKKNWNAPDFENEARYFMFLILLSAWKRMGYCLGRSITLKLQNRIRFLLKQRMVKKTARVPYRLLEDYAFQEITAGLQESIDGRLVWNVVQQIGNFMLFCVKTIGICILLGWVSPLLGMLFCAFEVCHFGIAAFGWERAGTEAWEENDVTRKRYLTELTLGRESAVERGLFAFGDYIGRKYVREERALREQSFHISLEVEKRMLVNRVLLMLAFIMVQTALTALLVENQIQIGTFVAFSVGIYFCLTQENREAYALWHLKRGKQFLQQWRLFLDLPETEQEDEKAYFRESFETLEFKQVAFRYPKTGRYVLRDLSLTIKKGGCYAFVGENGAGKSTIARLLSGLYDNYEGEILVNGRELREIAPGERRGLFAVLLQGGTGFQDTLFGNLFPQEMTAGEEEKKRKEAETLLEKWDRSDWRERFPQGLDTFLGNLEKGGAVLSRGEWQQLLINRLLAQPAQIRVLDEPLAALDIFGQKKAYRQLEQQWEGTTFLFSHRMAVVKRAKYIFVMENGRIAEEGTHEQLVANKGLYAEMYETQMLTS